MHIFAIDPGPRVSGWVYYNILTRNPELFGIDETRTVINAMENLDIDQLVIEKIGNQGNVVGDTTFDTCINIGRFMEAFGDDSNVCYEYTRSNIIIQLYGFIRKKKPDKTWFKVKNAILNAAIKERFGGDNIAVGGKKCPKCNGKGWFGAGRPVCPACNGGKWLYKPGPLFGMTSHCWDALALALCFADLKGPRHLLPPKRELPDIFKDDYHE